MSDSAICVERLSKKYVIGHQPKHQTLREFLSESTKSFTCRLRSIHRQSLKQPPSLEFWALQDVSFEVKQGEILGVIGCNGAGKSTLLKILSRITEPTSGRIQINGRVWSLLEVGTGFHPELTGRENIYLNGAILGMSKDEIQKKFDEIVDFSEIEKFLDTPVKRYSSGMYVKLAFAVAAHLEPEILIVDEVLAVGDIQFQKKCLGKMRDVSSGEGRTVLFVSHNMNAIQRLCSQCIMLEKGQIVAQGETSQIVLKYISKYSCKSSPNKWIDLSNVAHRGTGKARFVGTQYSSLDKNVDFQPYSDGCLEFLLGIESDIARTVGSLAVTIYDQAGTKLINADTISFGQVIELQQGFNKLKLKINELHLNPGSYIVGFWLADPLSGLSRRNALDYIESAFEIEVVNPRTEGPGIRPTSDGVATCQFEVLKEQVASL